MDVDGLVRLSALLARAKNARVSARKRSKLIRKANRFARKFSSDVNERAARTLAKRGLMLVKAETRGLYRVVSIKGWED